MDVRVRRRDRRTEKREGTMKTIRKEGESERGDTLHT